MARPPNILILMTDQQRYDHLGCAGNRWLRTPAMDRLAREGVHFTRAYTTSPVCMPARASLVSGVYPHNHQLYRNAGQLPAGDETFAQCLQRAGYYTAYVGKSHFYEHGAGAHLRDREDYMRARGFHYVHETTGPQATVTTESYMTDDWQRKGLLELYREDYRRRARHRGVAVWPSPLPVEDFLDSYIGRQSVAWLERHLDGTDGRPFLLWASFGGPHTPFDAPGEYATMYDPAAMPPAKPKAVAPAWAPEHVAQFLDRGRHFDAETAGALRANYAGKVSLVDRWFGQIMGVLERRGLLDDTFVLFCVDHGEMLGDHGLLGKTVFYEESVRVPLVMRYPHALPQGVRVEQPVELVDCFPTLVEVGGAERSDRTFGRSLLPLARGETKEHKPAVFSEIDRQIMVFDGRLKYAVDAEARGFMLYDLDIDPAEAINLIGHQDYKEQEQRLREAMLSWLVRTQVVLGGPSARGK